MNLTVNPGDLSGLLFFESPPNTTDILTGLTGLSSIAGGFDHAYVDDNALNNPDNNVIDVELNGFSNFSWPMNELAMGPFMTKMQDKLMCGHLTEVDNKHLFTVDVAAECRFWTEGVLSCIIAFIGLLGNLVSIWVLSVPELRNSFNRLLMALAIIDCMFIVPGIMIYSVKAFGWKADWYNYAFPVFLYPFSEMALCSSIYMTVAIAVERYIGLCRPLKRLSSGRGPCSAKVYIVPVVVIAILLNIPKFLESETAPMRNSFWNVTDVKTRVRVTALRTDPNYITYYWMWTRLLATGIVPVTVLAFLNTKIYMSIRHSKQQLRILAIRSALPMAILGQNAPSVPVTELLPNGSSSGGSNTPLSSPKRNGMVSPNRRSQLIAMQNQPHVKEEDLDDGEKISKAPDSPVHKNVAVGVKAPKNSGRKANGLTGRFVNGQMRYIQRSISAFDERTRHFRSKDPSILRSNSTSAATSTSVVMNQSWNSSAVAQVPNGPVGADMKLAPILFGVVIVFVLCNSLRIALNIYDFTEVEGIITCEKKGVGRLPPSWVLCTISVSHLLLMVNSSINFLVYCVAGTRFRRILMRKLRIKIKSFTDLICCPKKSEEAGPDPAGTMYRNNRPQPKGKRSDFENTKHNFVHPRRAMVENGALTVNLLPPANEDILEEEEEEDYEQEEGRPGNGRRNQCRAPSNL